MASKDNCNLRPSFAFGEQLNFGLDFYEVESYIVSEWLGDLSLKLNLRAQWITSIAHKWQFCTSMPPSSYNTKNVTVCANAELF